MKKIIRDVYLVHGPYGGSKIHRPKDGTLTNRSLLLFIYKHPKEGYKGYVYGWEQADESWHFICLLPADKLEELRALIIIDPRISYYRHGTVFAGVNNYGHVEATYMIKQNKRAFQNMPEKARQRIPRPHKPKVN